MTFCTKMLVISSIGFEVRNKGKFILDTFVNWNSKTVSVGGCVHHMKDPCELAVCGISFSAVMPWF